MQNIKNFKIVSATPELLAEFNNNTSVLFLQSDSGIDWYAAQKLFADDTIKIQYDENGAIHAVVDAPVPQRGNVYAVSVLWPINASVAEIAVADYPAGVALDGTWKFDEATQSVFQDGDIVAANTLRDNTALRDEYAVTAATAITVIQASAAVANPRDGDADKMLALQQYVDQLRDVDLTASPLQLPVAPDGLI